MKATMMPSSVAVQGARSVHAESTRKQIRGSSLLLVGRGFSLVINLITQIVVIRYLSRLDYGAFAWSFSVIEMTALGAAFGMDKSLSRFGAIYHERGDFRRLCGILVLSSSVLLITGVTVVAAVWGYSAELTSFLSVDPVAVSLLITLIVLVPANVFSSASLSIYTVFGKAHTVFVRRHLLGPSIRLAGVFVAILFQGGLQSIAMAYLVSGLAAMFIDAILVARYLREEDIPQKMKQERPIIPLREFFGYSLPLLTSDVAFLVRGTLIVFMLGWLATTTASASFRAVLPIVRLNELILVNFTLLFMPLASRLFSQKDEEQLGEMYQRTSVWAMVLSFPIFAVSITLAPSITVLMFGEEYADASTILIILSVGYYVQSMLGFNSQLMKVLGMARTFMALDVLATVLALTMCWFLIPRYGAQGAAIGVSSAIILHALSKYFAVRFLTNYAHQATDFNKSFLITGSCALVLIVAQACFNFHWSVGVLLASSTIYLVFSCNRHLLNITSFFPELNKIPLLGSWLSAPTATRHVMPSCEKIDSSNKLKIAYIMSRFPKITETFVLFEMREMERQGHHVDLFPLQKEKTSVIHTEAKTYVDRAFFTPWISFQIVLAHFYFLRKRPIIYFKTLWTLVTANWGSMRYLFGAVLFFPKVVYLARSIQKRNIDHLHVHFASHPAMAAWVIHQLTGISYSFTAHGSDLHRDQHMLKEKVADAAAVITISNYNRQMILDICGQKEASRVHVIHCGIDPQDFKAKEIPTSFDTGNGRFRFACVGTLHEVKGQRFLLEACLQLKKEGIDFQCHFVGDGPDQQMLEEFVLQEGLDEYVQFEGRLTSTEIQELLKRLDVLVAPSVPTQCGRREGIPVVLMEALGSGVSVIASDLSGIPEIVIDEQTGLLTPLGDSHAIAEALTRMYYDQPLRHRLAKAGQEKVMQEFNLPINVQSLVEILRKGK